MPGEIKKYFQMFERQRTFENRMTLWHIPLVYIRASGFIAAVTIFIDLYFDIPSKSALFF